MISLLTYLAFAVLAIVAPGVAIQRRMTGRVDANLALPVGFAFVAGAHALALGARLPWILPFLSLAFALDLIASRERIAWCPGPSLRGAVLPLAAIIGLFALTEYRQNRLDARGGFLVDSVDPEDQTFHAGLAFELSHAYPPQVPGLSGTPLDYHLGWPLVRGASARWAGTLPYDSMSRFDLTLGAIALVLALRAAVFAIGGPPIAIALVPWTLLACGYSWALARPDTEWWFTLFPGELLPHLFHSNSVVPALSLSIASLVMAARGSRFRLGDVLLAGALAAALPFFKIFLALQVLLGLGLCLALGADRRRALAVGAPLAAVTALLLVGSAGGARMNLIIDLFGPAFQTRRTLGLPSVHGLQAAAWTVLWLALSLGPRLAGLGALVRTMRGASLVGATLAVVAATGWPLSLLFALKTAEPYARLTQANDALYFMDQSGPLLWLFAAIALASWAKSRARAIMAVFAGAASFVSTAQFVAHKATAEPARIPPGIVRAMAALGRVANAGDVVLQEPEPKRYPPPPLVLLPLRVPYTRSIPYLTQFAPREALNQRLDLVRRFFSTTSAAEAREIARILGARFLCLYGSEGVAFPLADAFRMIDEQDSARVYERLP